MTRKKYLLATASAALALTVLAPAGIIGSASAASTSCWEVRTPESKFARKMNEERVSRGVGKLRLDPELSRVARAHNRKMAREDNLHHNPKLKRQVTNWGILGENVGVGSTVASLHEAFMKSQGHRLNILYRDYRYFGIGVKVEEDGRMWVTVVFEGKTDPGTTLKMPGC